MAPFNLNVSKSGHNYHDQHLTVPVYFVILSFFSKGTNFSSFVSFTYRAWAFRKQCYDFFNQFQYIFLRSFFYDGFCEASAVQISDCGSLKDEDKPSNYVGSTHLIRSTFTPVFSFHFQGAYILLQNQQSRPVCQPE